jgi:hypothetical protein
LSPLGLQLNFGVYVEKRVVEPSGKRRAQRKLDEKEKPMFEECSGCEKNRLRNLISIRNSLCDAERSVNTYSYDG